MTEGFPDLVLKNHEFYSYDEEREVEPWLTATFYEEAKELRFFCNFEDVVETYLMKQSEKQFPNKTIEYDSDCTGAWIEIFNVKEDEVTSFVNRCWKELKETQGWEEDIKSE